MKEDKGDDILNKKVTYVLIYKPECLYVRVSKWIFVMTNSVPFHGRKQPARRTAFRHE